jgi:choline-sulfatase
MMGNSWHWPSDLRSMPQALQAGGYHTAVIGKVHSHAGLEPYDVTAHEHETAERGFDEVFEVCGKSLPTWYRCRWTRHLESRGLFEKYLEDLRRRVAQLGGEDRYEPSFLAPDDTADGFIGNEACRWLGQYAADKPFFLHASFCGPHFPLDPPREFFDKYRPQDMPPPVGVTDPAQILRWQQLRALYCGLIEQVDRQVGGLLDILDRRALAGNTVVLFSTDHGDMIGDLGLNHKGVPNDASCRAPITMRWPGVVPAGAVLDGLAEAVDLPCTILDIAGRREDIPNLLPQSPGRSFLPYLAEQVSEIRPWAYAECGARRHWRMCCERGWKYVLGPDEREHLYDRNADGHDQHDLAGDPAAADPLHRLRRQLLLSITRVAAPNR